jgi:tetratricopeptide (TPR) repeat protein
MESAQGQLAAAKGNWSDLNRQNGSNMLDTSYGSNIRMRPRGAAYPLGVKEQAMANSGTTSAPNTESRPSEFEGLRRHIHHLAAEFLRLTAILVQDSVLLIAGLLAGVLTEFICNHWLGLDSSDWRFKVTITLSAGLFLLAYAITVTVHVANYIIEEIGAKGAGRPWQYLPWAFAAVVLIAVAVAATWSIAARKQAARKRDEDRQFALTLFAYTRAYTRVFAGSFLKLNPEVLEAVLQELKYDQPRVLGEMAWDSKQYIVDRLKLTPDAVELWNKDPMGSYIERLKQLNHEQLTGLSQRLDDEKFWLLPTMATYETGYLHYKLSKDDCAADASTSTCLAAVHFFIASKGQGSFVAPSYYMLGYIEQKRNDFAAAENDFSKAIEADRQYAAPYYARALVRVNMKRPPDEALDDLEKALHNPGGKEVVCMSIKTEAEIGTLWKPFYSDEKLKGRFNILRTECTPLQPQN